MPRLADQTLDLLPPGVRRPRYDRAALKIGMAHIGVGAFHRCHQAEYTDDVIEQEPGDWGVVGINLRPPSLGSTLEPQDGLYSRALRQGDEVELRVIGCIKRVIDGGESPDTAIAALASSSVVLSTLTITEKGYCHVPASGALDEGNEDILHDLRHPAAPRSALGLLTGALERRRTTHGKGMTLISCDNIPSNGHLLRQVLTDFARVRSPALADWIASEVRFPSTMVDRIVPATQSQDFDYARLECGLDDQGAVVGEPFRQWVVENDFSHGRPAWELAGAQFVQDVQPYELTKMRLLNAAQSAFAYYGALCGHSLTAESARDPVLQQVVRQMLERESAETVPAVPGMEPRTYIRRVFERVANPAIRHTNHQVATDGSQKIVQRLLNPIRDRIRQGRDVNGLTTAVAGWIAYLMASSARFGQRWRATDPWAAEISSMADRGLPEIEIVRRVVSIQPIFGTDLQQNGFSDVLASHVHGLLSPSPRDYLAQSGFLERERLA